MRENLQRRFFGVETVIVALISRSKTQLLQFDWRSAFGGLAPHMAHCVKVVLDDACAKSLQQEEASHSPGRATAAMSPAPQRPGSTAGSTSSHHTGDCCCGTYLEREIPQKIAKVLLDVAKTRVSVC